MEPSRSAVPAGTEDFPDAGAGLTREENPGVRHARGPGDLPHHEIRQAVGHPVHGLQLPDKDPVQERGLGAQLKALAFHQELAAQGSDGPRCAGGTRPPPSSKTGQGRAPARRNLGRVKQIEDAGVTQVLGDHGTDLLGPIRSLFSLQLGTGQIDQGRERPRRFHAGFASVEAHALASTTAGTASHLRPSPFKWASSWRIR